MDKLFTIILVVLAGLAVLAVVAIIVGIPVYFLWNWLCPALFGLPIVTLTEAIGLAFLSGALFKGGSSSSSSDTKPNRGRG